MQKCKSCGADIIWIKTPVSVMPCDPEPRNYRPDKNGESVIVTSGGEVIKARLTSPGQSIGTGYISHFATCPNAARHRKQGASKAKQESMCL